MMARARSGGGERDDAEDERAWAQIAARAMRPARANVAAIDAALAGVASADEAWEVLAARGLIPLAWARHPTRLLRRYRDPHVPPTVAAARSLAADVPGVERAEVLAREVVARLAPWGYAQPEFVRWKFLEHSPAEATGARVPLLGARALARRALEAVDRPRAEALARRASTEGALEALESGRMLVLARADFDAACAWRAAVAAGGLVVRGRRGRNRDAHADVQPELVGAPLATLADPFEPALELWRTGYMLGGLDGDAIVLLAG